MACAAGESWASSQPNCESSDDRVSGYIVPTTPWESIWKPIAEWLGVEAGQMDVVLPNANKFSNLLGQADVYN